MGTKVYVNGVNDSAEGTEWIPGSGSSAGGAREPRFGMLTHRRHRSGVGIKMSVATQVILLHYEGHYNYPTKEKKKAIIMGGVVLWEILR